MEHNTHREAGGAAHPQNPCSLGVLGLLSRGQEIPCHEASSVRIQVLLVHLHSQGWVGWNQPGPCIFPRQTRVSVLPPLLLPLWSSTEIGNQAGKLAGRGGKCHETLTLSQPWPKSRRKQCLNGRKIIATHENQSKAGPPMAAYLSGPKIWLYHKCMSWESGRLYLFPFPLFNISLPQVSFFIEYLSKAYYFI